MQMSVSEKTLKALKEFGLTEYEVQCYVSLVDGGEMSASDISSDSGVPYSRVYDVLGRLEEKGFIQSRRGRPTMYIPKAPTEVTRLVRITWENRLETASKAVVEELQPRFEQETQVTTRDVYLLHGRAAILAKALEMLDAAKEEVVLSVPTLDVEAIDIDTDLKDLSDVVDRILTLKIAKVRVLTADIPEEVQTLLPDSIEVRTRPRVFGIGMVTDARETLIMLAGAGQDRTFLGIYSNHAVFAEIASTYFNSLWKEANPV